MISYGIFKCPSTVQPIPIPLDLDKRLSVIHMRFSTSDKNEVICFTHINFCAVKNVGSIKLHQLIITTNQDIVERFLKFNDGNIFDPICLNFALDKEKTI